LTKSATEIQLEELLSKLPDEFLPSKAKVSVYRCERQLRSHAHTELKDFPDAKFWDLSVDYFGLTKDSLGKQSLILINLANSALGLTELGELHAYSRSVRPMLSLQIAETGLSRDLYNLLLRPEVSRRLLNGKSGRLVIYAGVPLGSTFSLDAFFPPLALGLGASRFQ